MRWFFQSSGNVVFIRSSHSHVGCLARLWYTFTIYDVLRLIRLYEVEGRRRDVVIWQCHVSVIVVERWFDVKAGHQLSNIHVSGFVVWLFRVVELSIMMLS